MYVGGVLRHILHLRPNKQNLTQNPSSEIDIFPCKMELCCYLYVLKRHLDIMNSTFPLHVCLFWMQFPVLLTNSVLFESSCYAFNFIDVFKFLVILEHTVTGCGKNILNYYRSILFDERWSSAERSGRLSYGSNYVRCLFFYHEDFETSCPS